MAPASLLGQELWQLLMQLLRRAYSGYADMSVTVLIRLGTGQTSSVGRYRLTCEQS